MRKLTLDEFNKLRRVMNDDEIQKLLEEMVDAGITKISYSTYAAPSHPTDKNMVDKIKQNYMGTFSTPSTPSTFPTPSRTFQHGMPNISPTDKDAVGMYEYQEPEQDEQGTFYGYKILHRHRNSYDTYALVSPRYPVEWRDGQLRADREPSEHSMFGIHCTKRPNHPELGQYCGQFHGSAYTYIEEHYEMEQTWVLVRCALGGTVVMTEQGFRAEYAQIVGVYQDGNWTSYKDYSERANAHSRYTPEAEFEWREDEYRRFRTGNWKAYTDLDAGSLP
jgi:hypothetical protein